MAYGVIKKMDDGHYNTPNKGQLMDIETGLVYDFTRPSLTAGKKPYKWNVKLHDYVSFTLTAGVATDVTLLQKYSKGTV